MTSAPLKVAVVGHTNTGKTSLLRTLTRNVCFGEVSPRPATTRHVEGTSVLLGGRKVMELFDTPGLEDSIGLLDHLETLAKGRRVEGIELVRRFLAGRKASGRFAQEARAIRQVLECDVALYVIDARDRVLGKHRDELEILGRCAKPIVPVLNFTAAADAQVGVWRDHLARVNMHVVAEFDTVVVDEASEERLFEKMKTVLDAHAATLDGLIEDRRRLRDSLVQASADLAADLLIDVAACVMPVPADDRAALEKGLETLRQRVRQREQEGVEQLLRLHQFRPEDYRADEFPLVDGRFGLDLFTPEALRQFGVRAGGAAAAGALVGLTLDAMTAGVTGGAGTATGAAVGGILGAGRTQARRLFDRLRGTSELRCDDATLRLLALRQILLIHALLRRGHAAVEPVAAARGGPLAEIRRRAVAALPAPLREARIRPRWSRLGEGSPRSAADPGREIAARELAAVIADAVRRPADAPPTFP